MGNHLDVELQPREGFTDATSTETLARLDLTEGLTVSQLNPLRMLIRAKSRAKRGLQICSLNPQLTNIL